jgi:hypothetical protein
VVLSEVESETTACVGSCLMADRPGTAPRVEPRMIYFEFRIWLFGSLGAYLAHIKKRPKRYLVDGESWMHPQATSLSPWSGVFHIELFNEFVRSKWVKPDDPHV